MSIFKESFKEFVKNQINERQERVKDNDRSYFLQRQCTIRMASGVNVDGNSKLAMDNVLQGGTLSHHMVTPTKTVNKDNPDQKEFAFKTRGGFDFAYDPPSNGYGHVPMPGITSVQIKTETAYGSLRGATVNFECHNIEQLSVLEKLYMRPGYPCVLEWGWLPFIDNKGKIQESMHYISDDGQFFTDPSFLKLKSDHDVQDAIQRHIRQKKEKNNGNYDGLYGIVKNFNYKVREDGGYSCTTNLISIGEVLDSLRGTISEYDRTKHSLEDILLDLNDYAEALTFGDIQKNESVGGYGDGTSNPFLDNDLEVQLESTHKDDEEYDPNADENKQQRAARAKEILNLLESKGVKRSDFYVVNEDPFYDKNGADVYMNWGILSKIIEDSIDTNDDGKHLVRITTKDRKGIELKYNKNTYLDDQVDKLIVKPYGVAGICNNFDISVNPKVCLFPSQIIDILGDTHDTDPKPFDIDGETVERETVSVGEVAEFGGLEITESDFVSDKNLATSTRIRDIYFNISYLYKTFKSQFYIKGEDGDDVYNEDFSIGKFIKTIWDDVNTSCGNGHNFQLITEFENQQKVKIIDLEVKTTLSSENLFEINALSTNSIVRDFNYDLTVPSSLTSTIAIAAQNPDNPGDLNQVTFAAFNKGIKNRFIGNTGKHGSKTSLVKYPIYKFHAAQQYLDDNVNMLLGNVEKFQATYINPGKILKIISELNDNLIELQIYLDRLKGYKRIKVGSGNENAIMGEINHTMLEYYGARDNSDNWWTDSFTSFEFKPEWSDIEDRTFIGETELVEKTILFNNAPQHAIKNVKWKLAGESFIDFGDIPNTLISRARTILREILKAKNILSQYNFTNTTLTSLAYPDTLIDGKLASSNNPTTISSTPDITSIIPLKFNLKLDGISGIIIGNLFKINKTRLPDSYKKSDVVFIVLGEEQEITDQDWTTTITGQVTLLK